MFSQISVLLMPFFSFLALKELCEVFSILIFLFQLKEGLCLYEFQLSSLAHQQLEQDLGLELEKNKLQNGCNRRDGTRGDSQMNRAGGGGEIHSLTPSFFQTSK